MPAYTDWPMQNGFVGQSEPILSPYSSHKNISSLFSLFLLTDCRSIAANSAPANATSVPTAAPLSALTRVPTSTPTTTLEPPSAFQNILVMIFQNKDQTEKMANPYLADLTKRGGHLSQYCGIAHPRQPNSIAMIRNDTFGGIEDSNHNLPQNTLVDLLEAADASWKA